MGNTCRFFDIQKSRAVANNNTIIDHYSFVCLFSQSEEIETSIAPLQAAAVPQVRRNGLRQASCSRVGCRGSKNWPKI